jgi:hypothetical protein
MLQNNLDTTLEEFKNEDEVRGPPQDNQARNMRIMRLEKAKKELLAKIMRVQEELMKEDGPEDKEATLRLQNSIISIIEGRDHPN